MLEFNELEGGILDLLLYPEVANLYICLTRPRARREAMAFPDVESVKTRALLLTPKSLSNLRMPSNCVEPFMLA